MHGHSTSNYDTSTTPTLNGLGAQAVALPLLIVGLVALALGWLSTLGSSGGGARFEFAYLINFVFFLSISLGGVIFIPILHIARTGWSIVIRRLAEIISHGVVPSAVIFLFIWLSVAFGTDSLFPWNDPEIVAADELVKHKTPYSNKTFFLIRGLFYFGVWILAVRLFTGLSTRQDETGDVKLTHRMEFFSAPAIVLYALTSTFAAIDWMMSLDPIFFSTIWGVYFFAGSMVAFFSTLMLVILFLQRAGVLTEPITVEHRHDVAKWLFFALCFWGYIAFSQYLLIWYANIPEETGWFGVRQEHGWGAVSFLLIFGHFAFPFLGMMSRTVKRNPKYMIFWAFYMLTLHWIDLWWLIMPQFTPTALTFGLPEILCFVGIGSIFAAGIIRLTGQYKMIPVRDPRLNESLNFHNI